jgi:hypothetical protein
MNPEFARYLETWPDDVDQARWRPAELAPGAWPDAPLGEVGAAARAAGIEVVVHCMYLFGELAVLSVKGQDEALRVPADTVATQIGVAVSDLPGAILVAVLRETPETGQQLSAFRVARPEERAGSDADLRSGGGRLGRAAHAEVAGLALNQRWFSVIHWPKISPADARSLASSSAPIW